MSGKMIYADISQLVCLYFILSYLGSGFGLFVPPSNLTLFFWLHLFALVTRSHEPTVTLTTFIF